ncbi:MAG: SPOR domain-containing protein [Vicinamibacterales bacterium]
MSELTHDDDGFHEIQLSGKQLVFLFIVTTTVIVVVFLCGVKVGRGARDAQVDDAEQAAAAPITQTAPVATPPATEPPAPAADAQDDLSYHKRLQGEGTPPERLKRQEEPKPESAPAPKTAPPVAEPAPAPVATTEHVPPAENLPTAGRSGTWAVQVIATRDRAIAGSVLKRLAAKGYPAFLVNPSANATPAWYKVQVGRYNDKGEAEKVSLRIKKEEQFQSWITR